VRQAGAKTKYVFVTDEMKRAAIDRALELASENDLGYLVSAIYMAMEYERLDSLGQLSGFSDESIEVSQG
jgi:hypothetical protein